MARAGDRSSFGVAMTAIGLAAGYVASVAFATSVSRMAGEGAAVWTAGGFLVGAMILLDGRWRIGAVAAALIGQAAVSLALGGGPLRAAAYPLASLAQAVIGGWLAVTYCGARDRRLSLRSLLLVLLGAIVPAQLLGGLIGGAVNAFVNHRPYLDAVARWTIPSTLGTALILPVLLYLARARQYEAFFKSPGEALGLFAALGGFSVVLFWQSDVPLAFALCPALALIAYRLGPLGAALAGILVALVGVPLTVTRHGPIMLATGLDMTGRVRLVQAMILAAMYTAFAMGGLVAERARLSRLFVLRDQVARRAIARARRAERELEAGRANKPSRARELADLA